LELEGLLVVVAMGALLEERPHRRGAQVAPADQPLISLKVVGDVKRLVALVASGGVWGGRWC
jgi:hypothetical protein